MKRLEKDSKTKLFVPGPAATSCTSHFEEEYRCGKYITLSDSAISTIVIKSKSNNKVCFDISVLFFQSYLSINYLTQLYLYNLLTQKKKLHQEILI